MTSSNCYLLLVASSCLVFVHGGLVESQDSVGDQYDVYEETTDLRFLYQCVDQHNAYRDRNGLPGLHYNREVSLMW